MTGEGGLAAKSAHVGRPLLWTALVLFLAVTALVVTSLALSGSSGSGFAWWPSESNRNLVYAAAGTNGQKLDRALERMARAEALTPLDPVGAANELEQASEDVADVRASIDRAPARIVSQGAPDWMGGAASIASLIAAVLGLLTAAVGLWVTRSSRARRVSRAAG